GGESVDLAGGAVVARELAAVHPGGVGRVGGHVAVLLDADGVPLAERDLAVVAAAADAGRAALLLTAAHAVRERVVRAHVVELRRRLVVPGAPGLAAVHGPDPALVAGKDHRPRIVGVDPEAVGIVAARRAAKRREGLAAVRRLPGHDVDAVDDVGVLRVDLDLREVAGTPPDPRVGVDPLPAEAGVLRAVEAARLRLVHERVDPLGPARPPSPAAPAHLLPLL